MKSFLLLLSSLLCLGSSAQVLVGDMNGDGEITAADVSQLVSTAVGKTDKRYVDSYLVNNTPIVGTWYKTRSESVTFNADSTQTYLSGYTYQFFPYQGQIVFFDTNGMESESLRVWNITSDYVVLGNSTPIRYTKTQPAQLVTSITLSKTDLVLAPSTSEQLSATVSPSDADNQDVKWTSSNIRVALVNSTSGKVTAVAAGKATITCTAQDGSGVKATCTVTVDSNLLPGKFSVSATKQVQFTKGNLYWDGSAFRFEENQTDYQSSWNTSHVSHFHWTSLKDYQSGKASYMPYTESFSYLSQSTEDKFWCGEENPLTVKGTSGLYALTGDYDEWWYLINSRTNASNLCKYGVTVTNNGTSYTGCLIIAPDDFTGILQSSYTLTEVNNLHLVCLPAAGYRYGSSLSYCGVLGDYWSATSYAGNYFYAHNLFFDSNSVYPAVSAERPYGYSLRLVRMVQ